MVLSPGRISPADLHRSQRTDQYRRLHASGRHVDRQRRHHGHGGLTIPALSVRRAETTVELPSGGSFAIAGLMQHATKQVIDGFPGAEGYAGAGRAVPQPRFPEQRNRAGGAGQRLSGAARPPKRNFAAPTDGFVAPTDPETLLLGRLNAVYKKDAKPVTPVAAAPVGFVVR